MKDWRRVVALLAALALVLGLCACGSSTPSGVQQSPPPVEYEEPEDTGPEYEEPEYEEPDDEEPEPEPVKPEGLVIVKESLLSGQEEYAVYCFNPDTKEETLLADFHIPAPSADVQYNISAYGYAVSGNAIAAYSEDYTKISCFKWFKDNGEKHAGWLDTNGNFTDVTEALNQQPKSDFEDPVYYRGAGFSGENFGYYHSNNDSFSNGEFFYVPIDNLVPEAILEGDVSKIGRPYDTSGMLLGKYRPIDVTDWLDDTRAIVNLRGSDGNSFIVDTAAQTETAYIPGDSRVNWNGVISPDGTKIAFMSEPKGGINSTTDIYIVPVDGGNPVKVEGLPYDLKGSSGQVGDGTCTLIGWI